MQPKIGYIYEDKEQTLAYSIGYEFVKEGEEPRWDSRKKTRIVYWEVPEND